MSVTVAASLGALLLATAPQAAEPHVIEEEFPVTGEIVSEEAPLDECGLPITCGLGIEPFAPCDFPLVFVQADNLWLARESDENEVFVSGITGGQLFALSTSDLDFDMEPGLRVTLGTALNCNTYVEVTYWGLQDFNQRFSAFGGGPVLLTGGANDLLTSVTSQVGSYDSNVDNVELNLRSYVFVYPHLSLLAGIRYIRMDEDFSVAETGTFNGMPALGAVLQETNNDMIGVHFGFDIMYPLGRRLELGGNGRVGFLSNPNDMTVVRGVTTATTATTENASDDGTDFTVALEGGVVASFKVTRNLLVRAGYHALFLSGVALAPEQTFPGVSPFGFVNSPAVDDDSDVFFHGPFVGAEFRWGACE